MAQPVLPIEEIVYGTEEKFHVSLPFYDISRKVKEANEALRKENFPFNDKKEHKVRFCKNLVDYEPENELSSDDGYDESTDVNGFSMGSDFIKVNHEPDSSTHKPNLLVLQNKSKEDIDEMDNMGISSRSLVNDNISENTFKHDQKCAKLKNEDDVGNNNDLTYELCNGTETKDLHRNQEISLDSFNLILNDMMVEKSYEDNSEHKIDVIANDITSKDSDISEIIEDIQMNFSQSYTTSRYSEEILGKNNILNEEHKQICPMAIQFLRKNLNSPIDNLTELKTINENKKLVTKSIKRSSNLKIIMLNGNQNVSTPYSTTTLNSNDKNNSDSKHFLHYKWNKTCLPSYNGLNSEYGLSAEMLEDRKRNTKILNQHSREKKREEAAEKELKKRENDESFREWLKKKEAERMKFFEECNEFQIVYDKQQAESAFRQWLKRKDKEKKSQRKLEIFQRKYKEQLLQKKSEEESQQIFKRWLQNKTRKTTSTICQRSHSDNRKRKPKKYLSEKNIQLKKTCKIYLGH